MGLAQRRLREVTVLSPRNASYGRRRELFEAKLSGLLGFTKRLVHDGRANSSDKPHV